MIFEGNLVNNMTIMPPLHCSAPPLSSIYPSWNQWCWERQRDYEILELFKIQTLSFRKWKAKIISWIHMLLLFVGCKYKCVRYFNMKWYIFNVRLIRPYSISVSCCLSLLLLLIIPGRCHGTFNYFIKDGKLVTRLIWIQCYQDQSSAQIVICPPTCLSLFQK